MPTPLTKGQTKALTALHEHGQLTEKRLKTVADIGGPHGAHAIMRTLMARGLVERDVTGQKGDLHSYYMYRLTPAGEEAIA
jgi:DNA-binding MarR family transcriptional regulator